MFVPNLFGIGSQQDTKNSSEEILGVHQGGLGLPDRDYYLKTDSASAATRTAYVSHIAHTLALAGDDSAAAESAASRIMAIETSLARISRSRTERRDPLATYHRMPVAAANALTPHIEWATWIADAGAPAVQSLNVADPDFFRGLDTLLEKVPVADWRGYLRWRYLEAAGPVLNSRFVDEDFQLERVLTGTTEDAASLEALRAVRGPINGSGAGPGVRRADFFAGGEGSGAVNGPQHGGGAA